MAEDVTVTDNPDEHRYEALVDGELAGKAVYRLEDDVISFVHTEIDSSFEGKGVGGVLVRRALDDVADRGTHRVRAICPFVSGWIDKHPDYQHLLTDQTEAGDGG